MAVCVSGDAGRACDPAIAASQPLREPVARLMVKPDGSLSRNSCSRCCNSAATVLHYCTDSGKELSKRHHIRPYLRCAFSIGRM